MNEPRKAGRRFRSRPKSLGKVVKDFNPSIFMPEETGGSKKGAPPPWLVRKRAGEAGGKSGGHGAGRSF